MTVKKFFLSGLLVCSFTAMAQTEADIPSKEDLSKSISEDACKCMDDIRTNNKSKTDINRDISECISQKVVLYQTIMGMKEHAGKASANIEVSVNPDSKIYKDAYYDLERMLMKSCARLKVLAAASDEEHDESISKNEKALEHYYAGIEESEKENWTEAIKYYQLAIKKDPKFAYAWDNMGICYRRLGEYDKAINAYEKSLAINPKGKMPLQNIPIAYIYKKEYQNAIKAYEKLNSIHPGDPEVYYGIGNIYATALKDSEKALDYLCKAYVIYSKTSSPYRTDAENLIGVCYQDMKKNGKEKKFREILAKNDINFD